MVAGVEGRCHFVRRDPFQIALQRWKHSGPFRSIQEVEDRACEKTSVEIGQHSEESDGRT